MLNRLKWTNIYGLSYAPPQLCKLPLKIISLFLIEMAKEARTGQTLNLIPAPWTNHRSVKIMQWFDPGCMQTSLWCVAHESLA